MPGRGKGNLPSLELTGQRLLARSQGSNLPCELGASRALHLP
jgi:hypothetical protein